MCETPRACLCVTVEVKESEIHRKGAKSKEFNASSHVM